MCQRIIFGVLAVLIVFYALCIAPPLRYPVGTVIHIDSGTSVGIVAAQLYSKNIISSPLVFKVVTTVLSSAGVQAGSYSLPKQNVITIAYRLVRGDTGLAPLSVTIPEGSTVRDMNELFTAALSDFEPALFRQLARGREGYLFPDTYHLLPGTPPGVIIRTMENNYESKVAPLRAEIASSTHSEAEIITMASILEREARKPETKAIIAGILWKRITLGMPLQVDAVFGYIFGRDTYSPTLDDLKVDSPYNTYTNKGLPPGPISSPGLDSIIAALRPTKTPYLYYLTGVDGKMYYSATFDGHVANRKKLR